MSYCQWSSEAGAFEFEGYRYYPSHYEAVEASPYAYLGDLHSIHLDLEYLESFRKDLHTHSVENAIVGDTFDGSSLNHHESARLGYSANRPSIFSEIESIKSFSDDLRDYITGDLMLIQGNHEAFAEKFFSKMSLNALTMFSKAEQVLLLDAFKFIVEHSEDTEKGIKYRTFFDYLLATHLHGYAVKMPSDTIYRNIVLSFHGCEFGVSKAGARNANVKIVAGHVHSAAIYRNITYVGTSAVLDPHYQSGMSRSSHAHAIIDSLGKRNLRIYLP
jgi:hypothetical protein